MKYDVSSTPNSSLFTQFSGVIIRKYELINFNFTTFICIFTEIIKNRFDDKSDLRLMSFVINPAENVQVYIFWAKFIPSKKMFSKFSGTRDFDSGQVLRSLKTRQK